MDTEEHPEPVWEVKTEGQVRLSSVAWTLALFLRSIWYRQQPDRQSEPPEEPVKSAET